MGQCETSFVLELSTDVRLLIKIKTEIASTGRRTRCLNVESAKLECHLDRKKVAKRHGKLIIITGDESDHAH